MPTRSPSNQTVLVFLVIACAIVALSASLDAPAPGPRPWLPQKDRGVVATIRGKLFDFLLGRRIFRDAPAAADDLAVRAAQLPNLDIEADTSDGAPVVANDRGW
jgi:hypothetical protein